MTAYSFDMEALEAVTLALRDAGSVIDDVGPPVLATLSGFAHDAAADYVASCLDSVRQRTVAWTASVHTRRSRLESLRAVALPSSYGGWSGNRRGVVAVGPGADREPTGGDRMRTLEATAALLLAVAALPVVPARSDRWIGSTLASMFSAAAGHPEEARLVAGLVTRHLNSAGAAAAFFSEVDSSYFRAMPAATGVATTNQWAVAEVMRGYAAALAAASHNSALRVAPAAFIDSPHGGFWLDAPGFSAEFLIEALVVALTTESYWPAWASEIGGRTPPVTADPRVVALRRLGALDGSLAAIVVARLHREGLLDELVAPRHEYSDGGVAAGALLARLGARLEPEAGPLVARLVDAIATQQPSPGVATGAAQMLAPHLAVFADPVHQAALPPTPLARVLTEHPNGDQLLTVVSDKLMGYEHAAAMLFAGFSFMLATAVRDNFDPAVSSSVAEPFGAAGSVFDQLLGSYVRMNLAHAREEEAARRILGGVISVALDVAIAAGPTVRAPMFAAEVMASASFNVFSGHVTSMVGPSESPEGVLLAAADLEDDMVDRGLLLLAVLLQEAGQLELPDEWYRNGALTVPSRSAWEAFAIELQAAGFPYFSWFNHAASIGGYASTSVHHGE